MVELKNTSRAAMELEKVQCLSGGEVETASDRQSKLHTADIQVEKVLHMKGGEGDNSYANNSSTQKMVILETKPILEESIVELYSNSFLECINVADLGCSSGPNTFLPTWQIIEALDTKCRCLNLKPPMLRLFLNDLPGNDFNTVFRSLLPSFCERLAKEKGNGFGPCFVAAVPGSFYERVFPPHSLHFIYSSYSLHWLSQVPVGLVSELGLPLNKGNIYISKTSPPSVHKAYSDQYEKDFTTFLNLRSEEMIPGGRMVLTFKCSEEDSSKKYGPNIWELIGIVLHDMVLEGLIEESKLDAFNMPYYAPYVDEVRQVIQTEGSFTINRLKTFQLSWDANIDDGNNGQVFDKYAKGKFVADRIRAIGEPILASHFGDAMMDDLFQRYCIKAMKYIEMGEGVLRNLVISMTKK